jgi:hypothetical protein
VAAHGVTEEFWEDVVGIAEWRVEVELPGSRLLALGSQPQSPQRDKMVGLLGIACLGVLVGVSAKYG